MKSIPTVTFEDTSIAFSYKNDGELKKANLIFKLVNNPITSTLATSLVKIGLALHLPIKQLVRTTVFEHFCGGETAAESELTVAKLAAFNVGAILDYSIEEEKNETGFNHTTLEICSTFEIAKKNRAIPFCVFKITGLGSSTLLEKIQSNQTLSPQEIASYEQIRVRVNQICQKAYDTQVPVLIDAEYSWTQNPVDDLAYEMMRKFNCERVIVFNTFQMYRADMLSQLKKAYQDAVTHNYYLGVKMVRGAYMEKEAERAAMFQYPNPIHPNKQATDSAFNDGLAFCLQNIQSISLICGSHNEYSNQYLTLLMQERGLPKNDNRIWFAQLLGMSDNISFNLAKAGYNVVKYVPYGPVKAVIPYLLRRASENTSVAGQSSRELTLIQKELKQRKALKSRH